MQYRIEKDTMGEVKVPVDALYGAQTQRSIEARDIWADPKASFQQPVVQNQVFAPIRRIYSSLDQHRANQPVGAIQLFTRR